MTLLLYIMCLYYTSWLNLCSYFIKSGLCKIIYTLAENLIHDYDLNIIYSTYEI